jgi:hypothetical protein
MIINKLNKKKISPIKLTILRKTTPDLWTFKAIFSIRKMPLLRSLLYAKDFFWKTALKSVFVKMQQN